MTGTSHPLRVLIVDDFDDTASSCGEVLRLYGHEVRLAPGGAEALALLAGWEPDVALLDLLMPGVDGYELARLIRARAAGGPLLVAVTGVSGGACQEEARKAGFDRVLVKPVDPDVLTALLRDHAASLSPR